MLRSPGIGSLLEASLAHPVRALGLFVALTSLWMLGLPRLRLETDGRKLIEPGHPGLELHSRVQQVYGSLDFLVVGLGAECGDVLTPAALGWMLRLSERAREIPGVDATRIRSLSTTVVPGGSDQGLVLAPLVTGEVRSPSEAESLREAVARSPLVRGTLIAEDRQALAVYIPLIPVVPGADRLRQVRQIRRAAEEELRRLPADGAGYRLHVLGPAAAESLLGEHILSDLALLLPVSLIPVAVLLWLRFRRVSLVGIALAEAGSTVAWSLGLLAWLDRPVTLVSVVMPVILATYCVTDTVHLACRYGEKLAEAGPAGSPAEAMRQALDELRAPLVFTSLTTCAGFLGFALSPIPPLRDFGISSAFGVLAALGISLLVVPTALVAVRFRPAPRKVGRRPESPALRLLTLQLARRPVAVAAVFLGFSVALGSGALRLRVQDSWIDNFQPAGELAQSERWFSHHFFGGNILSVVVDSGRERGALAPAFLRGLERLQERLRGRDEVGGSLSLADHLKAAGTMLGGPAELPATAAEAEERALLFEIADPGARVLDEYTDERRSTAHLRVFLNRADYRKTRAVVGTIEAGGDWPPGERPASIRFAGDAFLGMLVVDAIAGSLAASLPAALALVFLVSWWMLRSPAEAALAALPVSLAVLWNFGFLGWTGLPLGVATSTFSALSLGMGIDFALHWMARLRLALREGEDWPDALAATARSTGGAIVIQGAILLCGFGTLLLSRTPPIRHLGLLMAVNLLACLAASLVLLPAMATLARRRLLRAHTPPEAIAA